MDIKCYNNVNTQFAPFIHFSLYSCFCFLVLPFCLPTSSCTVSSPPFYVFSLPANIFCFISSSRLSFFFHFFTSSFVTFSLSLIAYFRLLNIFCLCILVFIDLRLFQDACSTELRNTRADRRCSEYLCKHLIIESMGSFNKMGGKLNLDVLFVLSVMDRSQNFGNRKSSN
jgi:hypothetical protein